MSFDKNSVFDTDHNFMRHTEEDQLDKFAERRKEKMNLSLVFDRYEESKSEI